MRNFFDRYGTSLEIRVLLKSTLDIESLSTKITLGFFRIKTLLREHHPTAVRHANAFAVNLARARNNFIAAGCNLHRISETKNSLQLAEEATKV